MSPFQKTSGEPVCRYALRTTGSETQLHFLRLTETTVRFVLTSKSRLKKRRQCLRVGVECAAPQKQTLFRKDATQCTFHRLHANSALPQPDPPANAFVFPKTKNSAWSLAEFLHEIFAEFSISRNEETVTHSVSRAPLRNPVFATLNKLARFDFDPFQFARQPQLRAGDSHAT